MPLQVCFVQHAINTAGVVEASGAQDKGTGDVLGRLNGNFSLFTQAIRDANLGTNKPANFYPCTAAGFLKMIRDGAAHARAWVKNFVWLSKSQHQVVPLKLHALVDLWEMGDDQSVIMLVEHLTR